jgi:serine protease SohB
MWQELLLFVAKAIIGVVAVGIVVVLIARAARSGGESSRGRLRVTRLNDRFGELEATVRLPRLGKKERKAWIKKREAEESSFETSGRPATFVIDFKGDLQASAVEELRETVSAVIAGHREGDEVLLRIESPGGTVHGYGLAASQLARLRAAKLRVVACVDKVAASGGYMMACESDEVVAAPFAIVGSIGVVASVPNLHRLLEKYGVDYEEMTAGEHKRTVSLFGKIEPEGREKFLEQLAEIHTLFREHVLRNRPHAKADLIATGEHWPASQAMELGLVDRIATSDDEVMRRVKEREVYEVSYRRPRSWQSRMGRAAAMQLLETLGIR